MSEQISVSEAGRKGGLQRAQNLSASERKRQARNAGIASGKSRKNKAQSRSKRERLLDGAQCETKKD